MKCEARSVEWGVWSVKCGVESGSVMWKVRSVECGL